MKPILALCILLPFSLCSAEESKPNIVLILSDDMGYGDLKTYRKR